MKNKKFIMVSHEGFVKIEKLLWILKSPIEIAVNGGEKTLKKKLDNLLKSAVYTDTNPVADDESVPAMLYDGNIILEYPSDRSH